MKIAVISDIHGNLEALEEAFSNIQNRDVDTVLCLGDLVGYGPYPNEVVEFIKKNNILSILGNYDAAVLEEKFNYIRDNEVNKFCMPWAAKEVNKENKTYLKSLPRQIVIEFNNRKIRFVHGSTRAINEYLIENSRQSEEVMENLQEDILVCAHTHIPFRKDYGSKILLNDGSIGKPKIGRPNGTYLIIDLESNHIKTEIIEFTYDYKKTIEAMKKKEIHESCINNIRTGVE
ncbi:metallophosphatase family protein [Clostridium tyrobutyricum]|uniref:metallophosphoesterase family protein n=1 Tax=Clostridium tyrobutyricum TaxID=1519 RepID=UPI001C380594|nr:metallophosphoesterase family protein [Clostridium tyrobutyricum]MBV4420377.1 metallophosphatase family protein [Clostridium tyrobutyricum]